MNENKKVADNQIEDKKKNSKNELNDQIDNEKKLIKNIDDYKEKCVKASKDFNKCLELLSLSIRGTQSNRIIDEASSNNAASIAKISEVLDTEREAAEKRLNNLRYEKDNLKKE